MSINPEARLIHKLQPDFHLSLPQGGLDAARRQEYRQETSSDPLKKIANFHRSIEKSHLSHGLGTVAFEKIRAFYYDKYVIKPEQIPERHFDNQRRIAREQGHGDVPVNDTVRRELTRVIIKDQKVTLDDWLEYLSGPDTSSYSVGLKHWAFAGMLKLGQFDKDTNSFDKRSSGTVAPFADLDREALAHTMDYVAKALAIEEDSSVKKPNRNAALKERIEDLDDTLATALLQEKKNFGQIYALVKSKIGHIELTKDVKGQWVRFHKNSDHMVLVNSLKGKGTGWCTAAESTAQEQLSKGDFYVFYSNDSEGNPKIPRAAIRMEGPKITEVRGVAKDQNLDPYIIDVVKNKLDEFPDGKLYAKKVDDMKQLTTIDRKLEQSTDLSLEELKFLYEVDNTIDGFGYRKDPRIKELRYKRDAKVDLAKVFNCNELEIATSIYELKEGVKYFAGDLRAKNTELTALPSTLEFVCGDLDLDQSKVTELSQSLERVSGNFNVSCLTQTTLPPRLSSIGGDFNLSYSAYENLPESLNYVGGNLNLKDSSIRKIPGTLTYIGGNFDLSDTKIQEIEEGLKYVGGTVNYFVSTLFSQEQKTAELPNSLEYVGGDLKMNFSKNTRIPASLKNIGGNFLVPEDATEFPPNLCSIGGSLSLSRSKIAHIPDSLAYIGGTLNLEESNMKQFPQGLEYIGKNLILRKSPIEEISGRLKCIGGDITLEDSRVKTISAPLEQVGGVFQLDIYNQSLEAWPKSLEQVGNIKGFGYYAPLTQLPPSLKYFGSSIDTSLGYTQAKQSYYGALKSLPDSLEHVNGNLVLGENFSTLPVNLKRIGGKLAIWQSKITELPEDLIYIGNFDDHFKLKRKPNLRLVIAS